ncbi:MAG: TonB-dependent receptor [Chromatiales bacterium]|nr:TonB-dependent receptor [Chromatiales bacterium]
MGWDSQVTINLLNPEDERTGNTLAKRAKRSARVDLDRDFGKWTLGGTLVAEGHRWNDPGNTIKLGGYATVGLRASYRLNKEWQLRGTVNNLFDRDYETSDGFALPGSELFISLAYQPQ